MINGIKPVVSTKTQVGSTSTYDEAMENFLTRLGSNVKEYVDGFNTMDSVHFEACGGRKYIKVKSFTHRIEKDYETGVESVVKDTNGSIHCFVEKTTGDIYKPATWRAPYTKGNNAVRGNIYNASTFERTDLHGGWLYDGSSFNDR